MQDLHWTHILHDLKRERAHSCFVLDITTSSRLLERIEQETSMQVSPPLFALLRYWHEQGSTAVLTTLPQLLNPTASGSDLEPARTPTRRLFPEWGTILDATSDIAIILDPTVGYSEYDLNSLVVGRYSTNKQPKSSYWAYYPPHSLDSLMQLEHIVGFRFSPQHKQLLLHANGAPDLTPPYFYAADWLRRGQLADEYRDFWGEIDSPEPFERLAAFVVLYEDGCGNKQGFFPDERRDHPEYMIYDWDHETARFTLKAPDIATWLNHLLRHGC